MSQSVGADLDISSLIVQTPSLVGSDSDHADEGQEEEAIQLWWNSDQQQALTATAITVQ